jgi:hypothetical protein
LERTSLKIYKLGSVKSEIFRCFCLDLKHGLANKKVRKSRRFSRLSFFHHWWILQEGTTLEMVLWVVFWKLALWMILKDRQQWRDHLLRMDIAWLPKINYIKLKGWHLLEDQSSHSQTNFESQNRSWKAQSAFIEKWSPPGTPVVNNRKDLWSNILPFLEPEFNDEWFSVRFLQCPDFHVIFREWKCHVITFLWS